MTSRKNNLGQFISNKILKKNEKYSLIIGETPSAGARSPKLWNKVYKKFKKETKMFPADVQKKNLYSLIRFLKRDNSFLGSAITTPYKEIILKYLNFCSVESRIIGSVNTLKKRGNKLEGYNTDFYGVINSLKYFKNKKKILILGCGGAGKAAILATIKKFRNSFFYFFNRDKKKLNLFLKKLKIKNYKIIDYKILSQLENIDLTINTTSIGFDSWILRNKKFYNLIFFTPFTNLKKVKGIKSKNRKQFIKKNNILIQRDKLNYFKFLKQNSNCEFFDIIYNPHMSKFLKLAKLKGHNTLNGLKMNFDQAVKAFCIVNNNKFEKINILMR
tara:strand:+ start:99 stop:1088 length:990 start_codon:yes stop_codon:yes gene_type:complete